LNLNLFNFDLPKNLIAQESINPPDSSKLLIIDGHNLSDAYTRDLTKILSLGDLIVVNNTKVIKSKILGVSKQKTYTFTFLSEHNKKVWKALAKGSKKLLIDDIVAFNGDMRGKILKKNDKGEIFIKITMQKVEFINYLNIYGELPLPPYIKDLKNKNINYQTLFAKNYGAVAAPTAGLHFTNKLKNNLISKGINIEEITLHVGAGTFLPVTVNDINSHQMYNEFIEISKNTADKINKTKISGGRIIAVGTTVLRALESSLDRNNLIIPNKGNTDIFIKPGYKIKSIDYLLTNFHLPKSTLFILVCALAGIENMQNAYKYAIKNNYRFYSLGDACLIKKQKI